MKEVLSWRACKILPPKKQSGSVWEQLLWGRGLHSSVPPPTRPRQEQTLDEAGNTSMHICMTKDEQGPRVLWLSIPTLGTLGKRRFYTGLGPKATVKSGRFAWTTSWCGLFYFVEAAKTYSPVRTVPWKSGVLEQSLLTVLFIQKQGWTKSAERGRSHLGEGGGPIQRQRCPVLEPS